MKHVAARAITFAASGLVSQGLTFALWLALPWFLTPAEVGFLALAFVAVEFLTMLGSLGMDAALIRFAIKPDTRSKSFRVAILVATVGFVLLAAAVPLVLQSGHVLLLNTTAWAMEHYLLILGAVGVNIAWNLGQSVQIAAGNVKLYAALQILRATVQLVLVCMALMFFERSAATVMIATTLTMFLLLLPLLRNTRLSTVLSHGITMADVKRMGRYGGLMMIYGLLGITIVYTQRLVVDYYTDTTVLGVFAFFSVIVTQATGLWSALNKAWTPEFFRLMESNRDRGFALARAMLTLLCIVYPGVLALVVVGAEAFVVDLLFPSAYAARTDILWMLLIGFFFAGLQSIAYPVYYYELMARRLLALMFFLACVNLGLSVVFIKIWQAEGAAASFFVLMALAAWTYFVAFRGWMGRQLAALLAVMTVMISGAGFVLLLTRSSTLFVITLVAASFVALVQGRALALPLIRRLLKSLRARNGFARFLYRSHHAGTD
jgi:O-antigen/teichoic acid export membrane protein